MILIRIMRLHIPFQPRGAFFFGATDKLESVLKWEKQKLEAVRVELSNALDRVNNVLKPPRNRNGSGLAAGNQTEDITVNPRR